MLAPWTLISVMWNHALAFHNEVPVMTQVDVELFNFIICYCMYWYSIHAGINLLHHLFISNTCARKSSLDIFEIGLFYFKRNCNLQIVITYGLVWLSLLWFLQCMKKMRHRFAQCTVIWNIFQNLVIHIFRNHNDEIVELSLLQVSWIISTARHNYFETYF